MKITKEKTIQEEFNGRKSKISQEMTPKKEIK
jgi:hypothetical protein